MTNDKHIPTGKERRISSFENIEKAVFKRKYEHFKSLLSNNNQALSLINELDDILLQHLPFDFDEVMSLCERLISIVYDISEDINAISGGEYPELFQATEKIGISILQEFAHKNMPDQTSWTVALEALNRDSHCQAGSKAANLGEILNRVNLPTPRGFAVTTFAAYQFLKQTGLDKLIKDKIKDVDISDTHSLNQACDQIQTGIMNADLPGDLEQAIAGEVADLENRFGAGIRMAVRSSATGEDSDSSFAGQHSTLLNVRSSNIIHAYKEVVASTFNPRAVFYHRSKGYRDIDVIMSVLCLIMVDSLSSGILYSVSPIKDENNDLYINANWGLGVSVVDGSMPTDFWQYSRTGKRVVRQEISLKKQMLVMDQDQGIIITSVPDNLQQEPCVNENQMEILADYGLRLEKHFGWPVDMEWTIDQTGKVLILQSRPLTRILQEQKTSQDQSLEDTSGHTLILQGGMTASSGTVSGPACIVDSEQNLASVPRGAVLIADHTSPGLVSVMSRIAGIITDVGSVTGHMASVAREFHIPTLVGTGNATQTIPDQEVITLDATHKKVYHGIVHGLLKAEKKSVNLMKDSPIFRLVRKNIKKIVPLTLIDPHQDNFSARGCTTLHDIVRFSHEMAMQHMFKLGQDIPLGKYRAVQLKTRLPVNIYILDLGGGLDITPGDAQATLEGISSIPFRALLKGMTHEKVPWAGPAGIDISRHVQDPEKQLDKYYNAGGKSGIPSYAIVSGEYLNFNARPGYHFITLDVYCSDQINDNYITFVFKGGAAEKNLRVKRAALIASILKRIGFRVEQKGDMVRAEMKKYDIPRLEEKLDYIGRLLGSVRFLDMVLRDDEDISWYTDEFLRGNYSFADPHTKERSR